MYGEFESELGLRLTGRHARTTLELAHGPLPIDMIANPTPELWGLAVNWEMVLSGLDDFLAGNTPLGMQSTGWRAFLRRTVGEHDPCQCTQ